MFLVFYILISKIKKIILISKIHPKSPQNNHSSSQNIHISPKIKLKMLHQVFFFFVSIHDKICDLIIHASVFIMMVNCHICIIILYN